MVPYIALFSWPFVSAIIFSRYSKAAAVLITILAGFLLLPEKISFDLPVLPPVNKNSIAAMAAALFAATMAAKAQDKLPVLSGWIPRSLVLNVLLVMLIGGEFITVLLNSDTLVYGEKVLPALRAYDAFSAVMFAIMFVLPVLLARRFLCSGQAHVMILKAFVIAALGYSLFILFELRMSPQMHNIVYGYFPHVFGQHSKGGGWRPVVFLSHGLILGMFLSFAVLSAVSLVKIDKTRRGLWIFAAVWLFLMLAVSKNFGAFVISTVIIGVMLLTAQRMQMLFAATLTLVFLLYPAVRNTQLIPIDTVVSMAEKVSVDRAWSLEYRLRNEGELLAKAQERPFFGWGGWGRNRVYDERGYSNTVTDGSWIIIKGTSGWVGYVATFGILATPIFILALRRRRLKVGPETIMLSLLLVGNLVDNIPNASLTPLTWLLAGALWGRIELGRAQAAADDDMVPEPEDMSPYAVGSKIKRGDNVSDARAAARSRAGYTRQTQKIERHR